MAEGAMGPKTAIDVVWNDTVNTKGEVERRYFWNIKGFFCILISKGEEHTNMGCDLYMEHENKAAKEDLSSAKG